MQERLKFWKRASKHRGLSSFQFEVKNSNEIEVKTFLSLKEDLQYQLTHHVFGDGSVIVKGSFLPSEEKLPELPRFGFTFPIPKEFKNLKWYGRGPHENYWDRRTSAFLGIYSSTVAEQYHPYMVGIDK